MQHTTSALTKQHSNDAPSVELPAHKSGRGKNRRRFFAKFVPTSVHPDCGDGTDEDDKLDRPDITWTAMLKATFGSPVALLFVFVPPGFVVNYTHQAPALIFILNFLAIVPSVSTLSFAVDELSLYVGDTTGGLLSMAFSNAAQLISSIFLLKTKQLDVLRSSLLGSILQNLLLMTGLAFLSGGLNREEQNFNPRVAQTMGMFLLLAVLSLTIPTVSQLWAHSSPAGVAAQSRGTAVIIMISYVLWLLFQLKTNRNLFEEPSAKVPTRNLPRAKAKGEASRALATVAATGAAMVGGAVNREVVVQYDEVYDKLPCLTKVYAMGSLVVFTVLLALNTQYATDAVQGIMASRRISEMFMGIVVLPLLSNDPSIILQAMKDKMDRSLAMTLDRCMQTALMVVPLVVLIAWGMGEDGMTLDFDGFSVATLFAAIIIVVYVVQEGKSNWLVGALLIKVFIMIGLSSFYVRQIV